MTAHRSAKKTAAQVLTKLDRFTARFFVYRAIPASAIDWRAWRRYRARGEPSNLAGIGRDILTLDVIAGPGRTKQGWGREIQLTDAIADQTRSCAPVFEAHWAARNLWL